MATVDGGWECEGCNCMNDSMLTNCQVCGTSMLAVSRIRGLSWILLVALAALIASIFATVGAFIGSLTGLLGGQGRDRGVCQCAILGAVVGILLSMDAVEASRTYLYHGRTRRQSSSSMVQFLKDILNGNFAVDRIGSAMSMLHNWQVSISDINYEELYELLGREEIEVKGVSKAYLETLPWHAITKESTMDASGDNICCIICLQELEEGEAARKLPECHHVFHRSCADNWLTRHGSCPICRKGLAVSLLS